MADELDQLWNPPDKPVAPPLPQLTVFDRIYMSLMPRCVPELGGANSITLIHPRCTHRLFCLMHCLLLRFFARAAPPAVPSQLRQFGSGVAGTMFRTRALGRRQQQPS